MAGFGTLGISGEALSRWTAIGLVIGFLGVAVLVGDGLHAAAAPWFAYLALVISPILWAGGSVVSRRNPEGRSEEHTSEFQSLMRHSYAVFCLHTITRTRVTETNSL